MPAGWSQLRYRFLYSLPLEQVTRIRGRRDFWAAELKSRAYIGRGDCALGEELSSRNTVLGLHFRVNVVFGVNA
jgi:hypothetical protein